MAGASGAPPADYPAAASIPGNPGGAPIDGQAQVFILSGARPDSFTVSKLLAGDLTNWTGGTYNFTVTCGGTSQSVSLTIGANGKTVTSNAFGPYAPNTTCSVTEGTLPDAGANASWVNSPSYSATSVSIAANQTATITVTNTRTYTPPTPTPKPTGAVAGATGTPSLPPTTSLPGQGGGPNGTILLLLGALGAASLALISLTLLRERLLDSVDR